jgi:8-oxo-dGTP pyrophosphatase MutT (NUDIX family)
LTESPAVERPTGRVPLPKGFGEAIRRFQEAGGVPVTPRTAATVLLLRPGAPRFEVYLQRRASTMAFAAGMYAFPGGSVDPRDSEISVGWGGPTPDEWSDRLGLPVAAAQAVVCAAVREVFEECGVLLAGPDVSTVVGDVSGPEWETDRLALLAREVGLAELLTARGLVVRSDLLAPFGRWLTPIFEARRFDTYFFVARLPVAQVPRDVGGEADHTVWLTPEQSLELTMLPPTRYHLEQLARMSDVDGALKAGGLLDLTEPTMPHHEHDDGGDWLVIG